MEAQRPVLLVLLLVSSAAIAPRTAGETPHATLSQLPRAKFTVFVAKAAIPEFLRHVKEYSTQHGFQLQSRQIRPDGEHRILKLDRIDLFIVVVNPFDPVEPAEFRVSIYETDAGKSTVDEGRLQTVLDQLKQSVCGLGGVSCGAAESAR